MFLFTTHWTTRRGGELIAPSYVDAPTPDVALPGARPLAGADRGRIRVVINEVGAARDTVIMLVPLADIAPDPAPVSVGWLVAVLLAVVLVAATLLVVFLIRRSR